MSFSVQIYSEAKECLNLLSHRLGSSHFFFGSTWVQSRANIHILLCVVYLIWAQFYKNTALYTFFLFVLFSNITLYRKPVTAEIRMTSCSETSSLCFLCCRPTSLDAFVFGYLAPLYKAGLPSAQLQQHLKQLHNLCQFCTNILKSYFSEAASGKTAVCGLVLELDTLSGFLDRCADMA